MGVSDIAGLRQAALRNIMRSNLVSMEAARTEEVVKPCKGPVCAGQRVCVHLSLVLSGTQPCASGKGIVALENTEQIIFYIFYIFLGHCSSEVTNKFTVFPFEKQELVLLSSFSLMIQPYPEYPNSTGITCSEII